ncbi:hypothetical protein BC938DRAFT_480456 [Jimgerdemannia flammicorona]|uniref:Uncharacterized protein n=1 Tax=Jimgerdemannia flammicorona TaxID=994334 RepID=A0A433QIF5_9FUNG|nr:hypothetical protein BC938DRAFT_480456 [Jimgerdemannia flammicorona]
MDAKPEVIIEWLILPQSKKGAKLSAPLNSSSSHSFLPFFCRQRLGCHFQ